MDRRLIRAYDKMTMPDRCSRRIEAQLQDQIEAKQEKRYTAVLRERPNKVTWAMAASLVCLAVLLSAGSAAVFFGIRGASAANAPEVPVFTQAEEELLETLPPEPQKDTDPFPYGEEGRAFLESMCHAMPVWDGYASLDDVFWTEFVVRLLNEYEYLSASEEQEGLLSSQVMTPAGQAVLMENRVYLQREQIAGFVQEAMGCALPEFVPNGEYADRIHYEDGVYSVQAMEQNRFHYVLESWKTGKKPSVTYGIYSDPEQPAIGQATFQLWKAENKWGFLIIGRIESMRMTQIQAPEIEKVALTFAEGFFSSDIERMKRHLSSREDISLILNPFVQGAYTRMKKDVDYRILGVRVFNGAMGDQQPVAFVDYAYIPIRDYPAHSLMLDMTQTEDGWKVRRWNEGNPESYDPDRGEIYDTAVSITFYYLHGSRTGMQDYMTSDQWDPPVYEGETVFVDLTKYPHIEKIDIYFDPLETDDVGNMMADAYIEIKESEESLNPMALYLHFVKQDGIWKADRVGEG